MLLVSLWLVAVLCEVLSIKGYVAVSGDNSETWPTFILLTLIIGLLFNPFDMMYKAFRFELLYSLYQNIIAPFGVVRFKDFFVGDVLTSMVRPLHDVYFTGCFFLSDEWRTLTVTNKCKLNHSIVLFVSLLPYHIRFWQCINRYYYTKMWFPHIVNAGKYLTTIIQITM
jgi:xenotropic and polytropic retrovirus receptor 1